MRWVRFRTRDGRVGFGTLDNGRLAVYEGDMFDSPANSGAVLERNSVTLLAPCTPSKMVALWNNFHALAAKLGKQAPAHPLFLIKPGTSIIGPGEPILRPPATPARSHTKANWASSSAARLQGGAVEAAPATTYSDIPASTT